MCSIIPCQFTNTYNLLSFLKRFLYILAVVAWLFVVALGLSLVAVSGGYSSLRFMGVSLRRLFSCFGAQAVGMQASIVAVLGLSCGPWAPELALSSGTQALLPCSMWDRRRQWHPTPVLLPGNSHGRRSLVGCSPWGR